MALAGHAFVSMPDGGPLTPAEESLHKQMGHAKARMRRRAPAAAPQRRIGLRAAAARGPQHERRAAVEGEAASTATPKQGFFSRAFSGSTVGKDKVRRRVRARLRARCMRADAAWPPRPAAGGAAHAVARGAFIPL